jgi:cytochrome c553
MIASLKSALKCTPVAIAVLASTASLANDPNLARNLAATCANCHGTNGRAVPGSGLDTLAGVDKAQLLQKLADYKSGAKPASIMHQISKGYTDEQLDMIAAYFAAQKK